MNSKTSLYIMAILAVMTLLALPPASATEHDVEDTLADDNANTIAAGIGTGVAQSHTGAAAVGAVAEDRGNFANSLIFIAIPETVVILGFVIANQILG